MEARMLYLHSLSPMHTGTGQATDIIDLPVAREKVTNWPYVPSSTLKGVLREATEGHLGLNSQLVTSAFGPRSIGQGDSAAAGSLWFFDAHLLCFPARSFYGTFAWITCPAALERWKRDYAALDNPAMTCTLPSPTIADDGAVAVTAGSALVKDGKVFLEDLDLIVAADESAHVGAIATRIGSAAFGKVATGATPGPWHVAFTQRIAVVSDNVFTFLTETATEIAPHIKIDDQRKTVADTGFWYEEAVPAEAIFSCPLVKAPNFKPSAPADEFTAMIGPSIVPPLQIGGHASTGRGLTRVRFEEV